MRGSWVGPLKVAEVELNRLEAESENDQFKVSGPAIEGIMMDPSGDAATFVEIKPETMCWIKGAPVRIVDVLSIYTSFRTTVGLPVATCR